MAKPWERYQTESSTSKPWEKYRRTGVEQPSEPGGAAEPRTRNPLAVANDTVIELANAAAGGVGAVADFVVPGNRLSRAIDDFVSYGEEKQSDSVKADRAKFREALDRSEGVSDDLAAVGDYLTDSPLQAAAQAVGSFALPGGAIKAGRAAAGAAGLGARGATVAARGAGISAGAALGGGDAAGSAYDLVQEIPEEQLLQHADAQAMLAEGRTVAEIRDALGTRAARDASILPALAGAAAGAFGAEKLLAGGRATQGGLRGALGTGAVEGFTEAAEEGLTQYEGRSAAQEYDPSIDPTKNVAAMAAMGGVQGGALGGALGAVPRRGVPDSVAETPDSIEQRYGDLARERAAQADMDLEDEGGLNQSPQALDSAGDLDQSSRASTRSLPSAETISDGDVLHANGQPFLTANAARLRAEAMGSRAQVMRYQNGFIVRPAAPTALHESAGQVAALEGPPQRPALAGPVSRGALPSPAGYSAGEGFTARESWQTPSDAPRGIRNNNPGRIRKGQGGEGEIEGNDPRLASFESPESGIRELALHLLADQRQHGEDTVEGIVRRRANSAEIDVEAYTGEVARTLNVKGNQQIDLANLETLKQLTAAIVRQENGVQPYTAEQLDGGVRAALAAAPARGSLPAPSSTLAVNAAGQAGSPAQHRAEAQRRADLGLTPDVVAAAERHPGASTDAAAHEAATSPTNGLPEPSAAQKEAGNYKVGRTRVAGLDISIENPEGSERRGTSPDGTAWANRMAGHYGYIRRTEGADGDQVDVFVRPGTAPEFSGPVFVVDQVDPGSGSFDESKVMLGYDSREQAEGAYRDSYTPDWRGMGKVVEMDVPTFKRWLAEGDTTRPAADSGMGVVVREPDITAKSGRPFLTRGAAQRAATAHGNADVVPRDGGFVVRPRAAASAGNVGAATIAEPGAGDPAGRPNPGEAREEQGTAVSVAADSLTPKADAGEGAVRPGERIEDFGETLHGARKHYAEQYAERMRAAEELPVDQHTLAETWPEANYAKLIEDGADPFAVALVRASRDELPAKPRQRWKLKGWADQVKLLREFSGALLDGRVKSADMRDRLGNSRDLRDVYGRARLYEAVGHDRSLRGVALRSGQYGVFAGEKFDTPRTIWTVERKASAGLGNWPEILAKGHSADAAIAEFKRAGVEQENQATPREVRFDIYSRSRMPGFYIGKKVGRVQIDLKHFDDVKAARAYLADNRGELVRRLEELKSVPAHRRESNSPRVGTDHRDGGDVTPTQFADAFGFRGVQFGNYVEGGRRQADLNEAFDALMDLAGVIGVPARALSLNGELGLAFGARGIGGRDAALAHYEPGQVVINLTKKRGAGSLAHEWWHGLDNYFSRRGGAPTGYASESGRTTAGIRPAMAEAFGALKQTIGLIGMRERSRKLDERKAKDYWSTGRELSARAFESYVIAKLADQGAANDYLANVVEEKAFRDEQSYPYPTAAEIAPVRAAFDAFFQTVEQVPGEDGRVALESRGEGGPGLELTDAQRLADDFMGKLPGAAGLRVSVVKSVDQIPESAKPSALAEGAYYPARDGGRIYLVAENLPTPERLQQVLAHEVVGHFGVEALLGDRFREVLVDVRRLARAPDGAHIPKNAGPEHPHYATFEAVTARYPDYSAENRAREVLARMAEQGKRTIFLGRLYGKIRAALRRLGLNLRLTNADIRQMVVDAGRFLQRAPAARVSAGMQEAAASMAASRAPESGGAAVTVLTGQELGSPELGAKELRDAARAWAAENLKGKGFVNRATGWRVQVSQRGIKESLSRSARISKIQSMAALPGLIEQAILGHTEPNRNKQRDPFTSQVHTLYAPVEIGGQDYLARLVVKESANGHLFYDHDLSDVVEAKRPDNTSAVSIPATKAGADRTPSGRAFTVEEIGEIVNREGRAGWVFDPGPLESRGEAATADAPPIQPGAPRNPRRGAKIERPGEVLSDIERRRRNMFLGKIGAWAEQDPIKERLVKLSDRWQARLVQGIFDQFAPLKAINPTAYMQARLSKGADGAAEYLVRHGPVKLEDGALDTAEGKGLADILAGLAGEHDHFMAWIAANRAERLAAEWQVRFENGVTERFADEATARAEAAKWPGAKAEPASRERLFTAEDIEVGKGLARGKMADGRNRAKVYAAALADFNQLQRSVLDVAEGAGLIDGGSRKLWESEFYVPFYRVMEDDNSGVMGPGQIGGLVGQQAYKRLRGGTDKLGDLVANTVSNWSHLLSAGMKNLAAQGALREAERLGVATPVRAGERGSVRAMFDGRERHFMVSDPLVMNALTSLHYVGSNDPFTKAARKFKHALTVGVTISPTFRVRNLIRDTVQAMAIDSSLSVNPVRNMVEGWKATGSASDTWRRLMAGGGAVRFGSFNDGNARNVKRLVDELGAHPDEVIASPAGLRRAMRKAFDWYQETGDRSETINRAAIYQQARKAGRSHLEASYAARDLMDFTAGGTFAAVRLLSQVVPFFNARLQGMYKLGRGAVENPARFAAVSGAVAMASALLYLGMKDDDDYKQLPDWARNTYWITKLPGTDRFVYIPKPFEVGALGSVVERGTELAFGGDDFRLGDFGKSVASILAEQLSMDPTPQLIKPAMEAAFNYDRFRDRAIDSVGQERLPASERFTASTSAGAVALGRALNVSPQRLEHLVRGYFGWLGTQALNVTDYAARPLSGLPENPRRDLSRLDNWFVVGDFVKDADPRSSKYIQRFYDEQRDINEVYAAYMQARQLGDIDRAQDLAADESLQLRGLFQAADKQMRQIRLQIKALERAPIPPEEKRARLDELYAARSRLAMLADQRVRAARP
ncbi:LPD5 domain-containing protein [Bordetella bronchiseptica]